MIFNLCIHYDFFKRPYTVLIVDLKSSSANSGIWVLLVLVSIDYVLFHEWTTFSLLFVY